MSENKRTTMKNVVTDADQAILEEKYEFLPSKKKPTTWQERMVEKYQGGLYKEFALADLSRPGKMGLRWRTKQEVLEGVGERTCGNKACMTSDRLITLRVPFAYMEQGVSKMEIVKLCFCAKCEPLVSRKRPRIKDDSQPSSKNAKSEPNEEQKPDEGSISDASNQEPGSQPAREISDLHKDKKHGDRDVNSEGDDSLGRRKRKRKSHRSSDSRRSRYRG